MSVSAIITDLQNEDNVYLATNRVVLTNPPISVTVSTNIISLAMMLDKQKSQQFLCSLDHTISREITNNPGGPSETLKGYC